MHAAVAADAGFWGSSGVGITSQSWLRTRLAAVTRLVRLARVSG